MKLCVDNDWLRRQIESDPNGEVEAGRGIRRSSDILTALEGAAGHQKTNDMQTARPVNQSEAALGLLVHMTRRRDRLSIAQFAEACPGSARRSYRLSRKTRITTRTSKNNPQSGKSNVRGFLGSSCLTLLPDARRIVDPARWMRNALFTKLRRRVPTNLSGAFQELRQAVA